MVLDLNEEIVRRNEKNASRISSCDSIESQSGEEREVKKLKTEPKKIIRNIEHGEKLAVEDPLSDEEDEEYDECEQQQLAGRYGLIQN